MSTRQAIAAAFQFLSRIPVPGELDYTPELFRRSTRFYPLVGLIIGIIAWLVGIGAGYVLPSMPAAVLVLIVWVALTGGLHLDGWMDTADGLLSYRSREAMLEIMKDSRVGAMGVIACVLLLMLKLSLIDAIIDQQLYSGLLLLPFIWSRWFMTYAMTAWPPARGKEGLGASFNGLNRKDRTLTLLLAVVLSLVAVCLTPLTGWEMSSWVPALVGLFLLPVVSVVVGRMAANRISRRLGGLTGDTYGALNELLEAILLAAALILLKLLN